MRATLLLLLLAGCSSQARTAGVEPIRQRTWTVDVGEMRLGALIEEVAYREGDGNRFRPFIIASDVDCEAVPVCAEQGQSVPLGAYLERLAEENALHVTHVGEIAVITKMPAALDVAADTSGTLVCADAWNAPARGWFALLGRATGECPAHGNAPLSFDLYGVTAADVAKATALASRVPCEGQHLADLPPFVTLDTGKKVPLDWQAVIGVRRPGGRGRSFVLLDDCVAEEGDRIGPAIHVDEISLNILRLRVGGAHHQLMAPDHERSE